MLGSVQALTNMEYALYGNTPNFGNAVAPSMVNGYCMNSAYLNPYYANQYYNPYVNMYNNGYYNNAAQDIFTQAGIQNTVQNTQQNQRDIDKIADFYSQNSQPSESMLGAAVGGAAFGLVNNPRLIAHPINTIKSLGTTEAAFKGIKDSTSNIGKLWAENNSVMREAYFRLNKIEARNFTKLGLFRQSYVKNPQEYEALKPIIEELKSAMNANDVEKVAEATAKLKVAYTNDGILSKFGGSIKRFFGGKTKPNTVKEALNDTEAIKAATNEILANKGSIKFKEALKRGGGVKGGLFFMAIEFLMSLGNIKEAFSKDNKTGMTQVGQTLVKGAGSAAGWAVGEAAGVWASTKICAAIGTAISPGLGTAIGGVLGLIGGSIGCWLAGKATKKLVGQDVGEKVKIEKMKQTPEGQAQLLQLTAQQKNIPLDVQQSIQNVAAQYSQAA
jgi:hypothetical protein